MIWPLVIVAAGAWPSAEQAVQFQQHDASGRLVQSHANFELVRQVSEALAKHCPDALVLVVTNQSDLMSTLVQSKLEPVEFSARAACSAARGSVPSRHASARKPGRLTRVGRT